MAQGAGQQAGAVEHTGGTLPVAPVPARHFPDAPFVNICRDGRTTAIPMYNHPGFRAMAISSLMLRKPRLDPFSHVNGRGSSPWVHVAARMQAHLMSPKRFLDRDGPAESFGWVWSGMIEKGTAFLNSLSSDRVLSMRFESLLESPREEMTRLVDFIAPELADARWLEEFAALPLRKTPSRVRLPREEQVRLARAHAPGQKIPGCPDHGGPRPWTRPALAMPTASPAAR